MIPRCAKLTVKTNCGVWWCTPLTPALRRQRQADLYEFEASLVYIVSSRTVRAVTHRNPVLKTTTTKSLKTKNLVTGPGIVALPLVPTRVVIMPLEVRRGR